MLSVSELKEACEFIEREYGSDSKVCIQIRDDDGVLYITNHKYKINR